MNTKQPEALRLAEMLERPGYGWNSTIEQYAAELRRQHAEIETLRAGYDAARLEIESLQTRLIHANEQHRLWFARSQELEAQLDAVGAGGMEPLRKTNSVEFDGIKTYHGQLLRAALQEAEAALEVALARILKRDPGHAVNVTSEAKALVIVRSALAESQTNHFRGATEMVQAAAPVVLPEPVAAQSRFTDTPSGTWGSCSVEHARSFGGVGYEVRYLYTEQQVRAMLAAAPKPPAHEPLRCSCHTCWPIAADDPASTFMRLCPACGNKRCPKANDHRHACTGSNEPGQPGSAYPLTGGITAAQKGDAPK